MRALFFGGEDEPLFGVSHPPRRSTANGRAVVLCHPFGHEYPNAHRPFRLLAAQLARAGAHAFRFDYYGSGDSSGRSDAGSLERWLGDLETAVNQVRALASPTAVDLIGLRGGAALVAQFASRHTGIDQLVLWDPVLEGRVYVEELLAVAADYQQAAGPAGLSVAGYPLTPRLRAELDNLDVRPLVERCAGRVSLVVSGGTIHETSLRAAGIDTTAMRASELFEEGRDWVEPHRPGVIPQRQMAWITQRLAGSAT